MQSTQLQPTQLTTSQPDADCQAPSVGFHERDTLIDLELGDAGRERKLFLTSLLLTSAIATLAITNLPQFFSSSQSNDSQIAHVEAIQANPIRLNAARSDANNQTVALIVHPSAQPTNITIHITAQAVATQASHAIVISPDALLPATAAIPASTASDPNSVHITIGTIATTSNADLVVSMPISIQR
jgi:hypothetical protein